MADNNNKQLDSLLFSILSDLSKSVKTNVSRISINNFISMINNTLSDLMEVDTILTQIAKENSRLSKIDLEKIGNDAFDIASKYGKSAADYLTSFQEAARAGYRNAAEIAELSLAVQSAGNMSAELAGQFINAADSAYELGGSVSELTKILDGICSISGRNSVTMSDLAEAMSAAGGQASELGIGAEETAAMLGTMISAAHLSGAEAADAFGDILLLMRQITDEGKGIDAGSLAQYEKACRALNISLKETKNGITSLRDPMEIIKDLSVAYSELGSNDTRRTNLLASVGGNTNAEALNAVLKKYSLYESMLSEYAQGMDSMSQRAAETADSWEGSLNRLSNTWTDTIGNIAESDVVITLINGLNGLLSVINNVTDGLGAFGTIGTIGIGVGITKFVKNFA